MLKKAVSLLLLVTLASSVALTGCSNKPAKPSGDEEKNLNEVTLEAEDYFKLKEPVDLVTAKVVWDPKMYPEGETHDNNAIYKLVQDTTNIKMSNKYGVPWDAYSQQVKLDIVADDIPDVFFADAQQYQELVKNEMIEDMTPYYEKYGTENLKKIFEYHDRINLKPFERDGKIYGIPAVSDDTSRPVLWVRKDWMEKLNIETPKSMEELLDMALKFTKEDPDGNGEADTYGMYLENGLAKSFQTICNAYGSFPKLYFKKDGSFTNGSIEPETKEALQKFAELYKEGVFDPEFGTKDMIKANELVSQGKVGIYIGEFFSPLSPLADPVKDGADWVGLKVPGFGGENFKIQLTPNHNGTYVVRKGYEHPEALIVILNNVAELMYHNNENPFAKGYNELNSQEKYINGQINNWMPFMTSSPTDNMGKLEAFEYALESKDESKLSASWKPTYDMVKKGLEGDVNNWAWPKVFLEGVKVCGTYDNFTYGDWFGAPTETAKSAGSILQKLESEAFINIIVGNKSIDEFDNFVQQWKAQGGEQILKEMDEASK